MKIIGKIIRWILGIFVILLGLSFMIMSWLCGVLCVLSGLLVLPPVVNKIPEFKHRKGIVNICSAVAFILAFVLVPIPESSETVLVGDTAESKSQIEETQQSKSTVSPHEETSQSEQSEIQTVKTSQPEVTSQPEEESGSESESSAATNDAAKKELTEWIESKISQGESVTNKERKKLNKIGEEEFLTVWKEVSLQKVISCEDDYNRTVYYMERAETVYKELYETDGEKINDIIKNVDDLSDILDENRKIRTKYGADIDQINSNYHIADFYITQRLEQSYSDNIVGKLQKEYDSYQAKNTSDWVAYDVEYLWDTPTAGDTFRILHANSLNPFTQEGAYEVAYYDTGSTTQISSSGGFVQEVPVYQLIEDTTAFENDNNEYYENLNQSANIYSSLIRALGGEVSEPKAEQVSPRQLEEDFGEGETFIGSWVDANNEWLYMEITCDDGVHYNIDMSERLTSSEFVRWSFVGYYDAYMDGLVYSNGKCWNIYQLEETLTYDDGSGVIWRGEDDLLGWNDNKENYGELSCFVPASDYTGGRKD